MPEEGTSLILDGEAIQRLAVADALAIVAQRFDLRCDGRLLDQARAARAAAVTAQETYATLAALRTRIATGVEAGTYRLMPLGGEVEAGDGALSRCFRSLITAPHTEGAVAWIDDRMVTGFARATMPILGVSDVLESMRQAGVITTDRRDSALSELRAAGALFLPVSLEEVMSTLRAAPVRGQRLLETEALARIRRSLGLIATYERCLAVRGGESTPEDRPDEVVPIQTAMRLLPDGLEQLWLDDTLDFDRRTACADWLWANARRAHIGRLLPGQETPAQGIFEILQLAHCVNQALEIGLFDDRRRRARLQYLQWLWLRAIRPLQSVDATLLPRLAQHLAALYTEVIRAEADRPPRERKFARILLARRVRALPEPLQSELFLDPRMVAFGRTSERITLGRVGFEPDAFWREVRRALRYGKGRLRVRRGPGRHWRRVHLRREGTNVILSGAIRARLGDATLPIVNLQGEARREKIGRVVAGFRLGPTETERVAAAAAAAPTITATMRILGEARKTSAFERYAEIGDALRSRKELFLEAFAPAPFALALAAMGIEDIGTPLGEALAAARRVREAEDSMAGLIETAGIPVLRSGEDTGVLAAASERARTPMAIVHCMAAAHASARPTGEVAQLCEKLVDAIRRSGDLFVALLRWTRRHFMRDAAWRAAAEPYALAVVWAHADRILDLAVGGNIPLDQFRRALDEEQIEVAGPDLLRNYPDGAPDVSWPLTISSAALLHHGVSAVFGSVDLRSALGDTLMGRVIEAQLVTIGGIVSPEVQLLMRRETWPNAMGSFLTASAADLNRDLLDRHRCRTVLVDSALEAIEAGASNVAAWSQLGAFATGGLEVPAMDRLRCLVSEDPARLVRLVTAGAHRSLWRMIVVPIAWQDPAYAAQLSQEIARACRYLEENRAADSVAPPTPEEASEELVEVAAMVAACHGDQRQRTFANLLDGYAREWAPLRPFFHEWIGRLTAGTPSERSHEFWRLHNLLGSR